MKRTNKLILLLVLAVFLFSAIASASASVIAGDVGKDAVGTKYEKAVSKLAALKILRGYEDGTVKPDGMITRAEFAAIAIQELGLSDQISNAPTQFSDVTTEHWASGIVNLAAGKGIVKGFPDGTFRPDEQVTYAQAAAMLVQMLGWGPAVDGQPWPSAVLYRAADLDISDGVTMNASAQANRGDIFIMASNALESDIMEQTSYGDNNDYTTDKGASPLDKYFDAEVWKDDTFVTAASNVNDDLNADEIMIDYDGKDYQLTLLYGSPVDYLGMEVEVWVDVDDKEVLWASDETNSSDVKYDFITKVDTGKDEITLDIADDEYEVDDDAVIYVMNEKESYNSLSKFESDFDEDDAFYGTIVLNDKGDVRFIAVANFSYVNAGFVTELDKDDVEYYEGDKDNTLDYSDYDDVFVYDSKFKALDQDAVDKDAVIYAWENDDDDELYVVVASQTLEGNLDRVSDDSVKIDGKSYDVSDRNDAEATVSDNDDEDIEYYLDGNDASDEAQNLVAEDVIAFLDLAGDVRHMRGASNASSGTLYGIMTDADRDAVTIFNENSKEVTYNVEERADSLPFYNYFTSDANSKDGNYIPVQYKLNKDGEVKEDTLKYVGVDSLITSNIDDDFEVEESAILKASSSKKIDLNKNDYIKFGSDYYYIEGSTVIMKYDFNDNDDPEVVDWSSIEDTDTSEASIAIIGEEGGKAKFVAFFDSFDDVASDDWYYAVVTDGPDYNGDDYEVQLQVLANDDIQSDWYVLDKDSDRTKIKEGTLVRFELSTSNKIKAVSNSDYFTVDSDAREVTYIDGKTLELEGISGNMRIDGDAVVYTVEDDGDLDKKRSYSNIKKGDIIVYLTDVDNSKLINAVLIVTEYEDYNLVDGDEDELEIEAIDDRTLEVGDVEEIVVDTNADEITAESSDEDVATVDVDDNFTITVNAEAVGEADITVTAVKDGIAEDVTFTVTVVEELELGDLEVEDPEVVNYAGIAGVFSGTLAQDGADDFSDYTVTIYYNGSEVGSGSANADGSFEIDFTPNILGSVVGYTYDVEDADGNVYEFDEIIKG